MSEGDKTGTTWLVDRPCPECRQKTIVGFLIVDEDGRHQHTHYICTFWRSGLASREEAYKPLHGWCKWMGWSVPEWNEDDE